MVAPAVGTVDGILYCYGGCGRRYADFGLDVILPTALWNRIAVGTPFDETQDKIEREGRGGVLCAQCIVDRLAKLPKVTVAVLSVDKAPERFRQACECGTPDPVMQANGKFYCHTCSFETGARPTALYPEDWMKEVEQLQEENARLKGIGQLDPAEAEALIAGLADVKAGRITSLEQIDAERLTAERAGGQAHQEEKDDAGLPR